jgi:hypothetical protein
MIVKIETTNPEGGLVIDVTLIINTMHKSQSMFLFEGEVSGINNKGFGFIG